MDLMGKNSKQVNCLGHCCFLNVIRGLRLYDLNDLHTPTAFLSYHTEFFLTFFSKISITKKVHLQVFAKIEVCKALRLLGTVQTLKNGFHLYLAFPDFEN